ncbi:LRR_1 domain-containing protein/Pkinase_Tyr domain-containing protein/LRRNT_2 domain-containing protein/LRR_6 domain-containing protein/LRR_8 domain-containing protein [Cephalotus follicularis]|uniref:non-specific serine/threonine protein kinase n=1 Tax=Cephalotus follicularis TaxID=3775 RepID=A0A1Q3D364_CEPFO|nr:LRR_1 domain-containing protein/Pkinase_Tyr domain-containing protein/LRRNT_2 domain-containing protein/LRR_6 domain-containing protein/LRR_8 domain-containing protein [Cephalotus follicularis]
MRRNHQFHLPHAFVFLIFTHLVATATITLSQATEKEILLQFKGNITGDPYNSLASWVSSGNPCVDFSGVFCNPAGFVDKIVLWNTSLAGVLAPALSGLKSLRVLTLFANKFEGNIPVEYAGLKTLWKINVSSNALSGSIPDFIGDLPSIRFLDLSKNAYGGEIPFNLFKFCYKTRFVSLSHNNLEGSIPVSIVNCTNLQGFDVSFNKLSGGIPLGICDIPVLEYISLRNNVFSGGVQVDVTKCQSLKLLDLGSNMFTGVAPFGALALTNMTYFNLSNNGFQGEITRIGTCSQSMEFFDASFNELGGEIPLSITSCKNLKILDLEDNRLNGTIPVGIGDMERLLVIRLGNNSIYGTIPAELGNIELLQVLNLHNLSLVGRIPDEISNCQFLRELDVSGNALGEEIPQTLYNMTYLQILDLHQNQLNGSIPPSLGNLSKIQYLDLSQNLLSGPIPPSLANLTKLTHFNVSFNHLSGIIPSIPKLQAFGASAFLNNPELCGSPLAPCLASGNGTTSTSGKTKLLSVSAIVAIVAAALILTGVCMVTIMNIRARRSKKDDETMVVESTPLGSTDSNVLIGKLVLFSKSLPSKYEDWETGTKALVDKECLIGGGSIGTVYRSTFEGGISIAVKKLQTLGRIRNQDEFEQEIGRLGNLRHPNLVAFQGYYWSSSLHLILSEFVPNGNLFDNLHGLNYPGTSTGSGNSELFWSRRFQIALGTARALSYLHHDCKPPILHLNIKSKNILLDEKYEAKLSDYGLLKLLPILDYYGLTQSHNAVGYVAPELAQSLTLSEKCDVYSFGVILLELVSGRKPVESPTTHEVVVLCEYVRVLLESGSASDCFDRSLQGFVENELIQVMKLGLICTSEVPSRRPSMAEVVQVLESIRNGLDS